MEKVTDVLEKAITDSCKHVIRFLQENKTTEGDKMAQLLALNLLIALHNAGVKLIKK